MRAFGRQVSVLVLAVGTVGVSACSPGVPVGFNLIHLGLTTHSSVQGVGTPLSNSFDVNLAGEVSAVSYLFSSIELCADGDSANGLNYAPRGGCAGIYRAKNEREIVQASGGTPSLSGLQAHPADLINLFDPSRSKELNRSGNIAGGDYIWLVIKLYPAALLRAGVAVGSGGTVVTRSGGSVSGTGTGAFNLVSETMLNASQEDALVPLPVSDIPQRLLTPLRVREEETGYIIDLVYDPIATLGACVSCGAGNLRDGVRGLHLSPLELIPVPRRTGYFTRREQYRITVSSSLRLLVSFYFASDTAARIMSVSVRHEFDSSSSSVALGTYDACRITSMNLNSDGTVDLGNAAQGFYIRGLIRRQSGTLALGSAECAAEGASFGYVFLGTQELRGAL